MPIALFHFQVTQIKRSSGQSAIAAAAYRAGEKLYSERYGDSPDYRNKGGVRHTEIMLPDHAPPEYADRQTLWNAVEKAEKSKKAQLAYSFDIALQNELSYEENLELARQFCQENFVSRGMIVDLAVHTPDAADGGISNPHFHVLCPIRPLKENGEWGEKQHRVYKLDENGSRIRDQNGEYVFNAVPTTDWNKPESLREWRKNWAELVNARFAENALSCRIDHRSLAEQGLDELPTIHEGPTVRAMEQKGIKTEVGSYNRMIRITNSMVRRFREAYAALCEIIAELKTKRERLRQPTFLEYLSAYYQERNDYAVQNYGYGANKAKTGNLQKLVHETEFLKERQIFFVDDLEQYVTDLTAWNSGLADSVKTKKKQIKDLKELLRHAENYKRYHPLAEEMNGIRWKSTRQKFEREHESELHQYYMARRILAEKVPDGKVRTKYWQSEIDRLTAETEEEQAQQTQVYNEMKTAVTIASHAREGQRKMEAEQHIGRKKTHER